MTSIRLLKKFASLDILKELKIKKGKLYIFDELVKILSC
jgi:hypothetical protein